MEFSQIDSAPGECAVVELDFHQASLPPGENGPEECDFISPAPLAGSSVCAGMVTGSLLFGSPHRLVRSCLYSAVLSLQWIDDIDISRESMGIPQNHHLGTVVWIVRLRIYLIPLNTKLNFAKIVLIFCYFYTAFEARAMASSRSPDMDQTGPSYAPSDPLPFFRHYSEKLLDLAPDIPDVMGLRALRPSAAVVKVYLGGDSG